MKGNASDSFNSSIRESKGLSLGRRSSDIRGKRRSPPLGYGFLLRASFPARCENAWLLARCPESCRDVPPHRPKADLRYACGLINPLSRRHIDQFVAVGNAPFLVAVPIAFPGGNDDGGASVADHIADPPPHPNEPLTPHHHPHPH